MVVFIINRWEVIGIWKYLRIQKKSFQKNVNILLFVIPKGIKLLPFNTSQYNPTSCVLTFSNLVYLTKKIFFIVFKYPIKIRHIKRYLYYFYNLFNI